MQSGYTLINDGVLIQSWMHDRSGLPIMRDFHGIARRRNDGTIVAAFGYDAFQPGGCAVHLCCEPNGLSRDLLRRAFWTPFIQWNYSYLVAIIQMSNHKSLNMADRLGFEKVGEIPGQLRFGVLYRKNCRWLTLAERSI